MYSHIVHTKNFHEAINSELELQRQYRHTETDNN